MKALLRNLNIASRLFSDMKKYDESIHPDIWVEIVFDPQGLL